MQATKAQSPRSKKNSQTSGTALGGGQKSIKDNSTAKSVAQRVMDVVALPEPPSTKVDKESPEGAAENLGEFAQLKNNNNNNPTEASQNKRPILKSSNIFNPLKSGPSNQQQLQSDLLNIPASATNEVAAADKDQPGSGETSMFKHKAPMIGDEKNLTETINQQTMHTSGRDHNVVPNEIVTNPKLSTSSHDSNTNSPTLVNTSTVVGQRVVNFNSSLNSDKDCELVAQTNASNTNDLNHDVADSISKQNSTTNNRPATGSSNEELIRCQSVFKQVISKNMKPPKSSLGCASETATASRQQQQQPQAASLDGSKCVRVTRISLDTRVPHPSKQSGFHSEEDEGVSYLNLGAHNLNNRAACSSLDNTTKPILIAAARQQRLGLQSRATASSQQLRPAPIQLQQHQFSPVSTHEYEGMAPEYDEYDTRYDNALVERRIRMKQLEIESSSRPANGDDNALESFYEYSIDRDNQRQAQYGGSTSMPPSPKAKSAPATPCNMTPTAFHQHNPNNLGSPRGATIAGQVCFGINNKDTCRALLASSNNNICVNNNSATGPSVSAQRLQTVNQIQDLDELASRGNRALESKDYLAAVNSYSRCIELATQNQNFAYLKESQVYGKRAEAHLELKNYNQSIDDSIAARELDPKWAQAYYLEGRAKLLIGEHLKSLPVFAYGLAQDPTNTKLFDALVEAALDSCYKQDFEPKLQKLRSLGLDRQPFVVVTMLGQEILAKGEHIEHAAVILELGLKLEASDDKKIMSSALSTVALAFCALEDYDKAIAYMQKELKVESELEDVNGQCRVLSNLGFTCFKLRKFDKSLEAHRRQLNLAMKSNLYHQASMALNAIGHVHVARNDFPDALTSHTRCLDILRQLADNEFSQLKEILSIGHIYCMMNDLKMADERCREAGQFLDTNQCRLTPEQYLIGCIMHRFNAAHSALRRQNFREAELSYEEVINFACELSKLSPKLAAVYQMRAYNGMGHTTRLCNRFSDSRGWFERQLKLAISERNPEGQSQALCNLGMIWQHFKDYNQAKRYFEKNLSLVDKNPLLRAYAQSYMGSIHFLLGHYKEAQTDYEGSLNLFKSLDYCLAERKTIELNIASVHERVGHKDLSYMNSPTSPVPATNCKK